MKKRSTTLWVSPGELKIQGWFAEAAPNWPVPTLEQLKPLAELLMRPVYHDGAAQSTVYTTDKKIATEAKLLRDAAALLLDHASKFYVHLIEAADEQKVAARDKRNGEFILHLDRFISEQEARIKPSRPGWHYLAYLIYEQVWFAWENAGHQGPIGKSPGLSALPSPGFSVVKMAIDAVNLCRGESDSSIRGALKDWPDPWPREGSVGWEELMSGGFAMLKGKRIYWEDAERRVRAGEWAKGPYEQSLYLDGTYDRQGAVVLRVPCDLVKDRSEPSVVFRPV